MPRGFPAHAACAALVAIACSMQVAAAQELRADHAGKAVYEQYCAACHNQPATRAPALAALQQMSAQTLRFTLTEGIMRQQGSAVPREQFEQLIGYLAAVDSNGDWVAGMLCRPDQRGVDLSQPVSMSMVGADARNSRRLSAQQSGLTSADLRNLELAWAIAFSSSLARVSPACISPIARAAMRPCLSIT